MSAPDAATAVRGCALLRGLPEEEVAGVVAASRLRSYPRGQIVFSAGDPGDTLVLVLSGRVKVVVRSADGGEFMLTVMGPGSCLGELSVADGGSRSADAETLEDARLLLIPRDVAAALCRRFPAVSTAMLDAIAGSLRRLTEAASDLVFLDLPRRIAKALLDQPVDRRGRASLQLSQEEMAHLVGGTRQSVNAALQGFARRGWVELHRGEVRVVAVAELARFCGS